MDTVSGMQPLACLVRRLPNSEHNFAALVMGLDKPRLTFLVAALKTKKYHLQFSSCQSSKLDLTIQFLPRLGAQSICCLSV